MKSYLFLLMLILTSNVALAAGKDPCTYDALMSNQLASITQSDPTARKIAISIFIGKSDGIPFRNTSFYYEIIEDEKIKRMLGRSNYKSQNGQCLLLSTELGTALYSSEEE